MPRKSANPLTMAEWKVMRTVWEKKSCAARDICEDLCEPNDWSVSTVKTILARLVDKGFLNTTQIGNSFLYKPARSAMKTLTSAADHLLDNTLEGTTGPLLSYMVKNSKLTEEDIDELISLLKKHKEGENKT
ncbi:MAG: BlaI/MecI/CopY family transcriptional regulator [Candidatus Omnitrophica bacterium]|nr:BlaI/MecI/CopY family transcriptional regulator [Candidatus Omnitrophota bacterium]